nr:MAG TPA: single-stranded-DNA-specific exonuclease RecJ [Caudoviricetes sp.]
MKIRPLLNKVTGDFIREYLVACGVNEEEVEHYIDLSGNGDIVYCYDYAGDYPNIDDACAEIDIVVENGGKIAILADSDVDGQCSSAIMYKFLKEYLDVPQDKIQVLFHTAKQHGLRAPDENMVQQVIDSGAKLLIIPDAGSSDNEPCMVLKENGVYTICVDHHETTPTSNNYATVVNHHLGNGLNTALSGTGVTFKLVERYCQLYLSKEMIQFIYNEYTPFVAVSLISDVCNMTTLENRAFFVVGINNLIYAKDLNELVQTLNYKGETDPHGFSFGCIPPINALCRSNDQEGKRVFFESLVGECDMAGGIAVLRKAVNEQRKTVDEIMSTIKEDMNNEHKATVGFIENEQANYTGLVANKMLSLVNKPSFILRPVNPTQYSGSMRSPFPIASIINESRLAKAEGHECASGLIMPKANLKKLLKYLDSHLTNDVICDTIDVTAKLSPQQINLPLCMNCEEYKDMWGSAGSGVVEPVFYVKFTCYQNWVRLFRKKTTTGKISAYGVDFIKFRLSEEQSAEWEKYDKFTFEAIVTLCTNEWNGRYYPQAMIQQYEIMPKSKVRSLADNDDWRDLF